LIFYSDINFSSDGKNTSLLTGAVQRVEQLYTGARRDDFLSSAN